MALSDEQKEIIKALEKEAKLRREISSSIESYVEAVKDSKKLSEEIANLSKLEKEYQKEIDDMLAGRKAYDHQIYIENLKTVSALQEQNALLTKNKNILDNTIKSVNKYELAANRAFIKGGAQMLKTFLNIDNVIKNAYGSLKGLGLFEMDKAMKKTALSMGLAGKRTEMLKSSIKSASENSIMFGASLEEIAQYQADYSDELGRSVMLGQKGLESIAEIAKGTGLGSENAAQMAASFEQQGISAERTRDFIEDTVNKTAKMGLNSSKVIKNMQANMKLLNKYNFKGGVKGLQKMAETTTKLGIDMNSIGGMADKLFDIEGAVEMSAQLQVLGGSWAQLGDPFKLMYMARNDMAGLTEEVAKAAASTAVFNKETGQFDISAMEMQRLRKISEATGISYEELATAAKNAAKFTKIKGQISFAADKDSKEFLENTAQLDEKGRAYIEIKGDKKYLNQLSKQQIKEMMDNKQSLKDRAKAAMTFDDTLKAAIDRFKIALLPLIEKFGKEGGLIDSLQKFIEKATTDGWFDKISKLAATIGDFINFGGKWVLKLAEFLGPEGTLATWAAFKAATWIANGYALSKGFLMGTKGFGGTPSGGGAGPTTGTGAGTTTAASVSKLSKFTNSFKGALPMAAVGGTLTAYNEYQEEKEKGLSSGKAGIKALIKGGLVTAGGAGGWALGAALAPETFGLSLLVPLAASAGASLFADKAADMIGDSVVGVQDGIFGGTQKRGIMQGGKITPIDNKDDILAMKPGGIVDNMMNKNTGTNLVKHEFGDLTINGTIVVTTPGNQNIGVDLLKDPMFVSELNQKLTKEIERSINQKNKKG